MTTDTRQPLDILMAEHGLSNADLVNASTEQLSFKMVQKGRKGRRLTPHIQEKILAALVKAKPALKVRRRDLFRYELAQESVDQILDATELIQHKKINYPQFIDLLVAAGVNRYAVEVGPNRITFYGGGGEAHIEEGTPLGEEQPGAYNELALRATITDAQKGLIDHPAFLRRIFEAGVTSYEVNLHSRHITYRGEGHSYKEEIPSAVPIETPKAKRAPAPKKAALALKPKKTTGVRNSLKSRLSQKSIELKRRRSIAKKKRKKKEG